VGCRPRGRLGPRACPRLSRPSQWSLHRARRARSGTRLWRAALVLVGHGGPLLGRVLADAQHPPHGRRQAGDRHSNSTRPGTTSCAWLGCASRAASSVLPAGKIGATQVPCPEHRCNHEINVVVLEAIWRKTSPVWRMAGCRCRVWPEDVRRQGASVDGGTGYDECARYQEARRRRV